MTKRKTVGSRASVKSPGKNQKVRPKPSASPTQGRNKLIACLLLVVGALLVYGSVRNFPFINFDDDDYVVKNAHIAGGLNWETIRWSLTSVVANNWHPITWLSHAFDCQLFALEPGGPHVVNLLIHICNVLLVFLLLERDTGQLGRSFVISALFAWHPFNVESVAWISERKNVLSTLLMLLTILAYGWYAKKPSVRRYLCVFVLFAVGLAAKPMLVTLPLLLLLLDFWPLRRFEIGTTDLGDSSLRRWSTLAKEKLPLLGLSLASSAITIYAQKSGGAIQSFQVLPLLARLETAARAYSLYLLKSLWPAGFALYYPNPFDPTLIQRPSPIDYALVVLGAIALLLATWIVWQRRHSYPYLLTGWLWFVISLVPVIGVVQVGTQAMADRYAYVPLLGIFLIATWGLAELWQRLDLTQEAPAWISAMILIGLGVITFRQTGYWHSSYQLWQHTREVTTNNYIADDKIAVLLLRQGDESALSFYLEAAKIAPWDPVSNEVVAAVLSSQGRFDEAIRSYEVVLNGSIDAEVLALAHSNLSVIYSSLHQYQLAQDNARDAMRIAPARIDREIVELSTSLAGAPSSEGYLNLAMLLEQEGKREAAESACRKALALSPNSDAARDFLTHLTDSANPS